MYVSSAERSFSKLKIIKTSGLPFRRRDSMVLALLAIENEAAKQLNTDDLLGTTAVQTIKPDNVN